MINFSLFFSHVRDVVSSRVDPTAFEHESILFDGK